MTAPVDPELLYPAMAGDRASLDALWRSERRWVAAVLLAHLPGPADLEDALQDVAMTLVGKIHGLQDPGAFRSWLRSVAVNRACSAARKRRPEVPVAADRDFPDASDARAVLAERVDDALERVSKLPIDLREPLLLRAVEGMTQREIAEALGVPETTVETRLARGRRALREQAGASHAPAPAVCNGWNRRTRS